MKTKPTLRRLQLSLAAVLAGGSTFESCEARLHDAVVNGTRAYVSAFLDPTNVLGLLLDEASADETLLP